MIAAALIVVLMAESAAEALPPGAVLRLGDRRFRADGEVRHLEFSADGRSLTRT